MSTNKSTHIEDSQSRLVTATDLIASGVPKAAKEMLEKLSTSELTLLLESTPPKERYAIWQLIPVEDEAEILQELKDDVRSAIIKIMDESELEAAAKSAAMTFETDNLVDFLQDLTEDKIKHFILDALDSKNRALVEKILQYPEDSAGGAMNTDAILVPYDVSLSIVRDYLQRLGKLPKQTDCIFVVDKDRTYMGSIALTSLLTNNPNLMVKDVIQEDSEDQYLNADTTEEEVAVFFVKNDLLSVAVVDDNKQVLGRITADDVVTIVREQGEHTYLGMAGLDEESDTFAPVKQSIRKRILWLLITISATYLSTFVIAIFEPTIEKVIALAILMPITSAIGGAAGNQTLALVLRGMLLRQIGQSNFRWLLSREVLVSLANGIMLAVLIAAVTYWRFEDWQLSTVICLSIIANLLISAVLGSSLPLMLKKVNIDPAISGNIILTTITDIMGFSLFLGLATMML